MFFDPFEFYERLEFWQQLVITITCVVVGLSTMRFSAIAHDKRQRRKRDEAFERKVPGLIQKHSE